MTACNRAVCPAGDCTAVCRVCVAASPGSHFCTPLIAPPALPCPALPCRGLCERAGPAPLPRHQPHQQQRAVLRGWKLGARHRVCGLQHPPGGESSREHCSQRYSIPLASPTSKLQPASQLVELGCPLHALPSACRRSACVDRVGGFNHLSSAARQDGLPDTSPVLCCLCLLCRSAGRHARLSDAQQPAGD